MLYLTLASDVTATGWTPSTGGSVAAVVDEVIADDADYVTSPDVTGSQAAYIGNLQNTIYPGTYVARFRAKWERRKGRIRIVLMDSSSNPVGTSNWQDVTDALADYSLTITTTGIASRLSIEVDKTPIWEGDTATSITYTSSVNAAYDITFEFDQAYPVGQFANGDWWVAPNTVGGSVTITAMTPALAQRGDNSYMHGWIVDPNSAANTQPFDSAMPYVTYNANLRPALPLTLQPTYATSVIKTVSHPTAGNTPQVQHAAVLTVLSAPDDMTAAFRPAFAGTLKTQYRVADIVLANIPHWDSSGFAGINGLTHSTIITRFQKPWLDYISGWTSRFIHPIESMPDYGSDLANQATTPAIRFMCSDFDFNDTTHKQALINYLQYCIDLRAQVNECGTTFPGDGGHGNGRRFPLFFGKHAFNDSSFTSQANANIWSETQMLYRSTVTGGALWGVVGTESAYWTGVASYYGTPSGNRIIRDPYQYIDGGTYDSFTNGGYQVCCTSNQFRYISIAIRMLGIETEWNDDGVLVEYADRITTYGMKRAPDPVAPCTGASGRGVTWGEDPDDSPYPYIAGAGRWPNLDQTKPTLGYPSTFGDNAYTWWVTNYG